MWTHFVRSNMWLFTQCLLVALWSQPSVLFISDTGAENDFEIVNATVLLRNSTGCFRIVIVDDSDPEPEENFTISFVVSKVQPEGINISVDQSEAVIIIQESDRKSHWCACILGNCLFPCMSIINCCILLSQVHFYQAYDSQASTYMLAYHIVGGVFVVEIFIKNSIRLPEWSLGFMASRR